MHADPMPFSSLDGLVYRVYMSLFLFWVFGAVSGDLPATGHCGLGGSGNWKGVGLLTPANPSCLLFVPVVDQGVLFRLIIGFIPAFRTTRQPPLPPALWPWWAAGLCPALVVFVDVGIACVSK